MYSTYLQNSLRLPFLHTALAACNVFPKTKLVTGLEPYTAQGKNSYMSQKIPPDMAWVWSEMGQVMVWL